jgi:protein involved in polysaccharide export with SLBB domain
MPFRLSISRRAALGLTAAGLIAGCAPKLPYAPADRIETSAASLDLARQVDQAVRDRLGYDGDFHPNDLIRLSFPYFPTMTGDQRVQMSGQISPPLLEPIQTHGLSVAALQQRLIEMYKAKLEDPVVSVSVLEYNRPPPPPEVFVMGEVTRPGAYPYRDGTTPFEALGRAGGGDPEADLSRIVVLSPEGDHMTGRMLDLRAVLAGKTSSLDYLKPFSVVLVPPTYLARTADRSRQMRAVIGFNGLTLGSSVSVVSP